MCVIVCALDLHQRLAGRAAIDVEYVVRHYDAVRDNEMARVMAFGGYGVELNLKVCVCVEC
jgi:hypothetical protein